MRIAGLTAGCPSLYRNIQSQLSLRFFVSTDQQWILSAGRAVVSEPMKIPRPAGAGLYFFRSRIDLPPVALAHAERVLVDLGHPGSLPTP
ncbi:hypothetical protein R3P93_24535, partial [Rhodococcus cerastii]|nr:hypothetical protein [Rhodococcus cerastii]